VLERPGQGHTCRAVAGPAITAPTGWVAATWVVAGFAVLYVVLALLLGKVMAGLPAAGTVGSAQAAQVAAISLVWLVVLAGTVISQVVWNRGTRRLAERYGFDGNLVVRAWFVRVYAATIFLSVVLQPLLGLSDHAGILLVTAIRAGAGLVLLANVLVGRARLLRLIADSAQQSRAARDGTAAEPAPAQAPPSDDDLDRLWGRITPQ
jgi:hypothetical protein